MKLFRNTTAVLVLTLFTGLAVFTAIQLGGRLFGTPTASAQTVTSQSATGQSSIGNGTSRAGGSGQSSSGSHPVRSLRLRWLERLRQLERRPDLHLPCHRLHGLELSRHAVTANVVSGGG